MRISKVIDNGNKEMIIYRLIKENSKLERQNIKLRKKLDNLCKSNKKLLKERNILSESKLVYDKRS